MARTSPTNSTSHYITRIKKLPMLTLDEEYSLAKKWREEGDRKAVDKLVNSHLRLVAKIASGYRGYGLPLSDLIAEGNVGMMQAMKHYDPERGFRLSTYAMWWIRASIQEYILKAWSLVKIGTTAGQKKLFFNLRKMKKTLKDYEGKQLTPDHISKIAQTLNVREDEVLMMDKRLSSPDFSLNVPVKETGGETTEWQDWLADDRQTQEHYVVHQDELNKRRSLVNQAMKALTQREQAILKERRLIEPPKTLEQLSGIHSISRERVRQIEIKAFEKLQKSIKRHVMIHHKNI